MSFILDALKKAERERNSGSVPDAAALSRTHAPPRRRGMHPVASALAGAAGMALVAGGGYWLLVSPAPPGSAAGAPSAPATPAAPPPAPAPATPAPPPPAPAPATPAAPPPAPATPAPPPPAPAPVIPAPSPPAPAPVIPAPPPPAPTPAPPAPPPPPAPRSVAPLAPEVPEASLVSVEVEAVVEGCRMVVRYQGHLLTLHLADVACPEPGSPWWPHAKGFMERLVVGRGGVIHTRREGGRQLADLYSADGPLLNRELVREGWAVAVGERFQPMEADARRKGVGMWRGSP